MQKRLLLINLVAHLSVPLSLFFPILQVSENASSLTQGSGAFNVFDFIRLNQYTYVSILLLVFLLCELIGAGYAVYGLVKKELPHLYRSTSFLLGFSSAVLGAMFISAGSYIFFTICALSFFFISYASIKLMKMEK